MDSIKHRPISPVAHNPNRCAFTLLEVVVALGIFAAGIVTVLALMGPLNRSSGKLNAANSAAGLRDAIQLQLERKRDGFAFSETTTRLDQLHSFLTGNNNSTARLIGNREGTRLVWASDVDNLPDAAVTPGIVSEDRFYLIEFQFPSDALEYTTGAGFMAVTARILWPYQTAADHIEQAESLDFNFALTP